MTHSLTVVYQPVNTTADILVVGVNSIRSTSLEGESDYAAHLRELLIGGAEADLDPFQFPSPAHPYRLAAAFDEVRADRFESASLSGVGP